MHRLAVALRVLAALSGVVRIRRRTLVDGSGPRRTSSGSMSLQMEMLLMVMDCGLIDPEARLRPS